MGSSLGIVGQGLAALAGCGALAGTASWWFRRDRRYAPGGHAQRDDGAHDPLARPLRYGFASAEIGVWLDEADRLQVGGGRHDQDPGNALGPLVLRPLAERVGRFGGHVHPGQRGPFTLMIDILETEPSRQLRAYHVLDQQLQAYPDLVTRMSSGIVLIGPVTVVLTGAGVPREVLAGAAERIVFCDGSLGDLGAWGAPASLVPVISEHWSWRFGWDGVDEMPAEERHLLRGVVAAGQDGGRRVRFFGIPHHPARVREAYWRELADAGVDLISTDELRPLARFLRRRAAVAIRPSMTVVRVRRRGLVARQLRRLGRTVGADAPGTR